jgi:phosphoribosylamine--glycine ligase
MKFFMVSLAGEGAGIAQRIADEGNEVKLYIKDEVYKNVYDGLLDKSEEITPDDDAIIIFDTSGMGDIANALKRAGHKVYGSSLFADKLEKDRMFGFDIMRHAGIRVPVTKEFDGFRDGINYVEQSKIKKFAFKPSGSMPCKLTYCADKEEMITYLNFVNEHYSKEIESFVMQEYIEGVVVSSEIYFDGEKVVGPPNHTVEVKKFMNDDLGPSTGCSGNIVWVAEGSDIIKQGVAKVADILESEDYVGPIDLNAVVNKSGVYGLEWTPRFGYDATPTYMKMIQMEYGKFFADIVNGHAINWAHTFDEMAAVRLTIPPYPIEPKHDSEEISPNMGVPIQGYEPHQNDLYLYEVKCQDGILQHSGGTGVIACVIKPYVSECYQILEEIKVPDKQYRTDLESVLDEMKEEAWTWQ